ncbi:hypothetical protein M407DRAFT_83697 [Tulasnella calospora MUT 4182]|uniref:Protein kinase domain-containing protein n=1 Tax=Tulasnella calospora MUT 4182 TaxID=1051891 RepID=A0A0C3PUR9_9AGAM|nr:hypothetical protein M407DRAFT_83697 [Tulasnella calospora MUT 4182]
MHIPSKQRLTREMIAWSACHHENILPFVGYFLSQDLETSYLVSPFIRNGNVKDYLTSKQAKPEERLELVRDTLKGLHYLHTRDPPIIHGDLKSLNVLVNDDRRAVLCDFGLAGAVRGGHSGLTTSSDFKGSTRWCSREVLMGDERTLKSDIWGWACLASEIITGNPPYYDIKSDAAVILVVCGEASKRKTPEPTPTPTFPNGLLELLRKCWDFEPDNRPDAGTCLAAISPVPQIGKVRIWVSSTGWMRSLFGA